MEKNVYWFTYPLTFNEKSKLEASYIGRQILFKITCCNARVQSNMVIKILISFVTLALTFAVASSQHDNVWIVWCVGVLIVVGIVPVVEYKEKNSFFLKEHYEKFALYKTRCDDDIRPILEKMENGE